MQSGKMEEKWGEDMPSERFLRLPEEKQRVIFAAAMEEFIRVPYDKVSINKIIQKAGISRGSFYTYFEDKGDLLSFVLEDTGKQWREFCMKYLNESEGDFWGMLENLFCSGIEFCKTTDMIKFHQNLLMFQENHLLELPLGKKEHCIIKTQFYENTDLSAFRDGSMEYYTMVLEQAILATVMSIASFYKQPDMEEQIKKDFKKKLNMLRYGACRESEENHMED